MLLTKLFSGLLAAVMVALGAGQIGNKNTQVGDELVVYTSSETQLDSRTSLRFHYPGETDKGVTTASNWTPITNGDPSTCNEGGALPCIVDLDGSPYNSLDEFLQANPSLSQIMSADELESTKSAL